MKKTLGLILAFLMAACAALADGDMSHVADTTDMTDVVDVVEAGMVPVTADALNEGTYPVMVDCSSSMFKIVDCALTVADGKMTALLIMKSDAYPYLYPGAAEDAAAADEAELLPLKADGETYTFTFPVPALDAGVDCAAFSARKALWYPRTLLFRADSLPAEAWKETAGVELADGEYLADVSLEGGKAKLLTPALMTVEGGEVRATLVFGTTKIDYVLVDGEKYLPEENENGVAFTVPVAGFDRGLSIIVDSTAIKPATEVGYTVTFDSASIVPFGE